MSKLQDAVPELKKAFPHYTFEYFPETLTSREIVLVKARPVGDVYVEGSVIYYSNGDRFCSSVQFVVDITSSTPIVSFTRLNTDATESLRDALSSATRAFGSLLKSVTAYFAFEVSRELAAKKEVAVNLIWDGFETGHALGRDFWKGNDDAK